MSEPAMRGALLASLLLLAGARPIAAAEPPPTVEELRRQLAEQQALAQSSAARLRDLEERFTALTRALERLESLRATDPEVRATVDALRQQVHDLERQVARARERDERPPAAHPGGVNAGYDEGLFVDAGPLRLKLNGLMQIRYTGEANVFAGAISSFDAHRLQLGLTITATRWIAGRVFVELGSGYLPGAPFARPDGTLLDAYLEARPLSWMWLRAGRFLVPFARQRLIADGLLAEPERNPATLAFAPGRDFGVGAGLSLWDRRFELALALTNGDTAANLSPIVNGNIDLRYSARLVLAPLGPVAPVEGDPTGEAPFGVAIGAAVTYDLTPTSDRVNQDRDGDGRRDNVGVLQAGGELALAWRRLSLQAEYFLRLERYGANLGERVYHGGYAQGQLVIVRGWLMAAARVTYAEPHTLGLPTPAPSSALIDAHSPLSLWDTGASLIGFYRSHRVKLQLSYAWRHSRISTGEVDAHLVQAQISAAF